MFSSLAFSEHLVVVDMEDRSPQQWLSVTLFLAQFRVLDKSDRCMVALGWNIHKPGRH